MDLNGQVTSDSDNDDWLIQEFASLVVEHASRGMGATLFEKIYEQVALASSAALQDLKSDIARAAKAEELARQGQQALVAGMAGLEKAVLSRLAQQDLQIAELKQILESSAVPKTLLARSDALLAKSEQLNKAADKNSLKLDSLSQQLNSRRMWTPATAGTGTKQPEFGISTFLHLLAAGLLSAIFTATLLAVPLAIVWQRGLLTVEAPRAALRPVRDVEAVPRPERPSSEEISRAPDQTTSDGSAAAPPPVGEPSGPARLSLADLLDSRVDFAVCQKKAGGTTFKNCLKQAGTTRHSGDPLRSPQDLSSLLGEVKDDELYRELVLGVLQRVAKATTPEDTIRIDGKDPAKAIAVLKKAKTPCIPANEVALPSEKLVRKTWQPYAKRLIDLCIVPAATTPR